MVGNDVYMKGNYVEFSIRGAGGYEGVDTAVSPPPSGYHKRSSTSYFGIVANPQQNGWTSYDGDFFAPGLPENGWGFEVGNAGTSGLNESNNCSNPSNIPGSITNYSVSGSHLSAIWEGNATTGTDLHFTINYNLNSSDLFYTTTVSIKNNTFFTIPLLYFCRNIDPDNNQELNNDYVTINSIDNQPNFDSCNLALVSAKQNIPWNSYIGLMGIGNGFKAAHGGFTNRDASDIWNGIGFNNGVGDTTHRDEAIAIAYRIQNLAPGATETFSFAVLLDESAVYTAANSLLYLNVNNNSGSIIGSNSSDTVLTCGDSVSLAVSANLSSLFDWHWSPAQGLSDTVGSSVYANPADTTVYTLVGIPLTTCFDTVRTSITVIPSA